MNSISILYVYMGVFAFIALVAMIFRRHLTADFFKMAVFSGFLALFLVVLAARINGVSWETIEQVVLYMHSVS